MAGRPDGLAIRNTPVVQRRLPGWYRLRDVQKLEALFRDPTTRHWLSARLEVTDDDLRRYAAPPASLAVVPPRKGNPRAKTRQPRHHMSTLPGTPQPDDTGFGSHSNGMEAAQQLRVAADTADPGTGAALEVQSFTLCGHSARRKQRVAAGFDAAAAVWPEAKLDAESRLLKGPFSLQPGRQGATVHRLASPCVHLAGGTVHMQHNECLLFEGNGEGCQLRNMAFHGGVVVFRGRACKASIDLCDFERCAIVVLDGAQARLDGVRCLGDQQAGAAISLLAHGKGTYASVANSTISGGLQGVAVHEHAKMDCVDSYISSMGHRMLAVEGKGEYTMVRLKGCVVAGAHMLQHTRDFMEVDTTPGNWDGILENVGVLVHGGAKGRIVDSTVLRFTYNLYVRAAGLVAQGCFLKGHLHGTAVVKGKGYLHLDDCDLFEPVAFGPCTVNGAPWVELLSKRSFVNAKGCRVG